MAPRRPAPGRYPPGESFAMPSHLPPWIPPMRGDLHSLRGLGAAMPLIRNGGVHLVETALWLPSHTHQHWELHYLHRGQLDVAADDRLLSARGGWFMLTSPGRVHRARDGVMAPCQ